MQSRINRFLLAYALLVSTLSAGALVTQAIGAQNKVAFDEIDVKRINVREEDGTLRLVISNTKRFPGVIVKGKEQPHPNRQTAGLLFFNEEGTENGGLTWDGSKRNGKVSSGGHLSFDRYEQDQVIQLTQSEQEDSRMAAMIMSDRPDQPMDFAGLAKVTRPFDEGRRFEEELGDQCDLKAARGSFARLFQLCKPDCLRGHRRMAFRVTGQ
jgi:hypothetical protein